MVWKIVIVGMKVWDERTPADTLFQKKDIYYGTWIHPVPHD